jgi:hypothetical protein
MKCKDATRSFGSVGSLLTVLLMLLVSAGAAYACPEHGSKVAYRTRSASPYMGTTLITYGSPAVSGRCSESSYNSYIPSRAKYVAMRANYGNTPTYINYGYPMSRTRYVTMNNDFDYAPRYVAVRHQPAYVDSGMSYVVMRNAPRIKYVAVRDYDMDNADYGYTPTRYVVEHRNPVYDTGTRYVAVSNINSGYYDNPARYVAVRNTGCGCAMSNLEDVDETISPRHVVVKADDLAGTQEVVYPDTSYNDTAYLAEPGTSNVAYNVGYFHNNGERIAPVSYVDTGRTNFVPTQYDSEIEDQAILDNSDAAYVANDDIEDACLSPVVLRSSPMRTKAVSYVPLNEANEMVSYVPETDTEDINTVPVSYVPVKHKHKHAAAISYVPAANVTYVPASNLQGSAISYVPADSVDYVDTAGTAACECPASENSLVTNTNDIADTSTEIVEASNLDTTVVLSGGLTFAGANGYREGFEDGRKAAKHGNAYLPEITGDFLKATKGYKDTFGDKEAYRDAFRDSYLKGYRAGFDSYIDSD